MEIGIVALTCLACGSLLTLLACWGAGAFDGWDEALEAYGRGFQDALIRTASQMVDPSSGCRRCGMPCPACEPRPAETEDSLFTEFSPAINDRPSTIPHSPKGPVMARSRVQLPRNAQLGRLRQQIETTALGPIEITRPLPQEIETAALGVPRQFPSPIPLPPPGGWPEDAGWREEAEHRQGLMGEDPQ